MDHYERNYSSLSELENLSDSDWLDIASSRASEDDDSIAEFEDSDREDVDGRPPSRHSFTSYSSSRDEVVDAWEGLIDDSSDLETPLPPPDGSELISALTAEADRPSSPLAEEDPEDERVKAALDQSMMSTLSSSRSNSLSNSVQTSMVHSTRALRLSFPDPTTSRINSLNTSFEVLSPADAKLPAKDASAAEPGAFTTESTADPGPSPTPEVPEEIVREHDSVVTAPPIKPDLCIVLYGSSPLSKDALVQMLLDKWAMSIGLVLVQTIDEAPCVVSHIFTAQAAQSWKAPLRSVCVVDKTSLQQSRMSFEHDCPSLAIIFLPTYSDISMFEHTLYLPIMTSSPLSLVDFLSSTDYLLEAEQQWEELGVPTHKLTSLSDFSSPVVDQERIERATPGQVQHALKPLTLTPSAKKTATQVSAYAISIMAVLSIVLGCIVHGSTSVQGAYEVYDMGRTVDALSKPWFGVVHPATVSTNKSSPTSLLAITSPGSALSASSLKDLAVALFNPATVTTATTSSASQSVASSSSIPVSSQAPSECDCGCGLLTWPGKTDVMVRPTASSSALTTVGNTPKSISVVSPQSYPVNTGKGKGKASMIDTSLYALSTRIVTSLSEYLDFNTATKVAKAVNQDMQDLMDAIDQLMQAIARQTTMIWKQSKGTMSLLQDELRGRNAHAKERARQVREYGMQWLTSVSERIKVRAEAANRNAKAIREKLGKSEMNMKSASQVWEELLVRRMKRKQAMQERKQARRMRRALRRAERAGEV